MSQQQPPEWWSRKQGPRLGCADVTIVSIAAIAAFVVLILVLGRSDVLLERLPIANVNPTVGAAKSVSPNEIIPTARPAVLPTATLAPAPSPTAAPPSPTAAPPPSPTVSFKRASIKQTCRLRADATVQTDRNVLRFLQPNTAVKQLGDQKANDGVNWFYVEVDDGTGAKGWVQEICFS